MKSIMQEASSIMKAIEKGWEAAGKPKEFSIKVFEEGKKNFIGMTTESAKVGIFFNETVAFKPERAHYEQKQKMRQQHQPQRPAPQQPQQQQRVERPKEQPQRELRPTSAIWTNEMIDAATNWIRGTLKSLDQAALPFTVAADNYQLRFTFSGPLLDHAEKEQQLLRSLSFLLLCSLKRTFKRPLRGYKIVFIRS
ncbi:MAG: hypothetical protein BWY54_00184 [Candidatus Dependentiae bacterium ADurb.Bin331]|nr:MAG: hypothetical protein BWY54_00184 [Candidatus Dependentiae bacterium ADurb.Bin331]